MNRVTTKKERDFFLKYTVMFLIAAMALIAVFAVQGKHMVGEMDGVHQHYTTLAYIRDAVRNLLAGNGFKMVDLQIGQGLDTIGTLSYYGLADPISLIGVLFPESMLEYAYALIICLRLYLTGLFFCIYLKKIRIGDAWSVSVAGIAYCFSGFFLKGTLRHPYFSDGGIYLALMLIAAERHLRDRRWLMFVLITALMLIANYYFAFQTTLLVIAYIIMRLVFDFKSDGLARTAKKGFSLLGAYLLGAALTAVYFLPVFISYMGNARIDHVSGYTRSLLFYDLNYYIRLLFGFSAPYITVGSWMHENFVPVVLLGMIFLFVRKKDGMNGIEHRQQLQLRAAFAIVFVFACIPLFGRLFNGLGYVCNRWCYGFAFAVCAAAAWALPELMQAENASIRTVILCGGIFTVLMAVSAVFIEPVIMFAGAAAMGAFTLFLLIVRKNVRLHGRPAMRLLAALTVCCVIAFEAAVYLPLGGEFALDYGKGRFYTELKNETAAASEYIDADGFCRVDAGACDDCHQKIHGYNGVALYWSVIPEHVSAYYRDLEMPGLDCLNRLYGYGASSSLNALAAVGWCLRNSENDLLLPYGYTQTGSADQADGDCVRIFRNDYALPLGYLFTDTMSEADYAALGPVEKQAALLDRAVLADAAGEPCESVVRSIEWTPAEADGVEIAGDRLIARKDGTLTLRFTGLPDAENWFVLDGLKTEEASETNPYIEFISEAGMNKCKLSEPTSTFYYDQKGVSVSLGCSESGMSECTLRFSCDMTLRFGSININCLPMDHYRERIRALQAGGMRNAAVENNRITGSVDAAQGGILQIAVPYSKGWSAAVDGEKAEIVRCGGMYMGIALDAGSHTVELNYVTPGLKTGACCSAAALALLIILLFITKRKKQNG